MSYITVTNTFVNSTTASATDVNTNFTDIINGLSDGTKDISVSAITAAGTATLNGHVNLGNSSSDDLTISASLAATVPIKTNTSFDIGSSTKGLQYVYMGASSTYTTRLGSATQTASRLYTIPASDADTSFMMKRGTQTNDSASSGDIGEYISSSTTFVTFATTAIYGDLTNISIFPGDWDVAFGIQARLNGGTMTGGSVDAFIGTVAGNSASGRNEGDNQTEFEPPTSAYQSTGAVPAYRMSVAATTTVYLKYRAFYSAGSPQAKGRISARRVR